MSDDEREKLRKGIIEALEIGYWRIYNEPQSAFHVGVDLSTMKRWRRTKPNFPYTKLGGRKIRYYGFQIADILIDGIKGG